MLAAAENRFPFDKVVVATESRGKISATERTTAVLSRYAGRRRVPVHSINPETYRPEANLAEPDKVALQKNETLRRHANLDGATLLVAGDVTTTLIDAEGTRIDLSRLLRQVPFHQSQREKQPKAKWKKLLDVLQEDQQRMVARCCNGQFSVEWQVGYAIESLDGSFVRTGVIVVQATFGQLDQEIVAQAYMLSDDLEEMKRKRKKPTQPQLVKGVSALRIGPRLPFAEQLTNPDHSKNVTVFNRDNIEQSYDMTTQQIIALITQCQLPARMVFKLLTSTEPELVGAVA